MELPIIELTELTEQIENAFSKIEKGRTEKFLTERDQNIENQRALRERARRANIENQKVLRERARRARRAREGKLLRPS